MAEKTVEKDIICQNCGVEVRPDTTFCYNCGSSVEVRNKNGKGADFPRETNKLSEKDLPVIEAEADLSAEEQTGKKLIAAKKKRDGENTVSKDKQMKSAASLRKKEKNIQRKQVEYFWDEPQSAPNVWFLVVAFLLTLFAVGIFMAMRYLR